MIAAFASAQRGGRARMAMPLRERDAHDARADQQDADHHERRRQLAQEQDAEQRDEQRRRAAHQRVGERQVAGAIGLRQRQVVAEVDHHRCHREGPRCGQRQRHEGQREERADRRAGHHGGGVEQRVAAAGRLEQRVPAGVQEPGAEDGEGDARGQFHPGCLGRSSRGRGRACAGRSPAPRRSGRAAASRRRRPSPGRPTGARRRHPARRAAR